VASSEVEICPRGRPALERGGDLPEGSRGWLFDGLAEVTWAMGSFLLQAMIVRSVIHGLWVRYVLLFCEKWGLSLVIRGPSWLSPTVAPSLCSGIR
jgi:hypothetical protein